MGGVLGQLSKTTARIVMLGLDSAGKTTILYKLKLKDFSKSNSATVPTIGFNVETVSPYRGVTFVVWDAGGQEKIRCLWRHYFKGCDVLLFVIDCGDRARIELAKEELWAILKDENLEGVPLIVIANKQDMKDAIKPRQLTEELDLAKLTDRAWKIQGTCAITGDGLKDAMDLLVSIVKSQKKQR